MTSAATAAPDDQVVTYQVHEDPADPDSPVRLTFTIQLTPAQRIGNALGWRIMVVEIAEPSRNGSPEKTWRDTSQRSEAPEELWWIDHADPESPDPKEFVDLPERVGTATAVANTGAALRYSLASNADFDPATGRPIIRATYSIALESNPETPIVAGEDEPVESGGRPEGN